MIWKNRIVFVFIIGLGFPLSLIAQNWSALDEGLNGAVRFIYNDTIEDQLIVCGHFTTAGGITVDGIATWNGTSWDSLATGIFNNNVPIAAVRFQGDIYSEGIIVPLRNSLLRLSETGWEEVGITSTGTISRLRVIDNRLYAVGFIDSIANVAANGIAAYDGTEWYGVGNDLNPVYLADVAEYQGELYVVGKFDNGQGLANIAKLVNGEWQSVGGGIPTWDGWASELVVFQDKLYVAGFFYQWEGNVAHNIMAWDGNEWISPQDGVQHSNGQGFIRNINTDGEYLYVTGSFDSAGNLPVIDMARWDGQNWCGFDVWTNSSAGIIMPYQNNLIIAGGFYWVNDTIISHIAVSDYYIDSCGITGIEETEKQLSELTIHPNPTTSTTTLTWQAQNHGSYQLNLYDVHGRQVRHQNGKQTTGKNTLAIDLSTLAKGIYFGRLVVEEEIRSFKLVKE